MNSTRVVPLVKLILRCDGANWGALALGPSTCWFGYLLHGWASAALVDLDPQQCAPGEAEGAPFAEETEHSGYFPPHTHRSQSVLL